MENTTVIMLRYGEIFLKGGNRGYFESALIHNVKSALTGIPCRLSRLQSRFFLDNISEDRITEAVERLKRVFGLYSLSIVKRVPSDLESIRAEVQRIAPDTGTFRVTVNRADKRLPLNSQQIAAAAGGYVLEHNPKLKVDLFNPDRELMVDIRENGTAYVFEGKTMCAGGMPVGTGGMGMLLISGGIDSPVAGWRMAGRGMKLCAVHFHSFPYTGELAREKVLTLLKLLTPYTGDIGLSVVKFTHIQEEIHRACPANFMITIMRRFMMRISEILAKKYGCGGLITGESLGQVASQTIESMTATNAVVSIPVLRPLVGMDKEEIIASARKIGTYSTSILPYEDCCTVFLPKNPVIKPKLADIEEAEKALDIDALVKEALENVETIDIKG